MYHLSKLGGGVFAGGEAARKHPISPHLLRRYLDIGHWFVGHFRLRMDTPTIAASAATTSQPNQSPQRV